MTDEDFRIVPCERCGSEGRIIRDRAAPYWADEPQEVDCGECPECDGTGGAIIEVEPVEEEDVMLPTALKARAALAEQTEALKP